MSTHAIDLLHMTRALQLAAHGEGHVEPNPMVGCVIARGDQVIAHGWHESFGEAHAEILALHLAPQDALSEATMYVTLEPCCHHGRTPPCVDAVLASGIRRVVIAMEDPFPQVAGRGIKQLRDSGVEVVVGTLEAEARNLCAPYLCLIEQARPWIHAKWAMTLDGKIATHLGDSQWISGESSRQLVHRLRSRMDAVIVGRRTAELDDPLLTARPPGPRRSARIVVDSKARLRPSSRLVQSVDQAPVWVAVGPDASARDCQRLADAGCEVITCCEANRTDRLVELARILGRRRLTNVLAEGGGQILGGLFDAHLIDEVHVFIGPKLVGGERAVTPIAGLGRREMSEAAQLDSHSVEQIGEDIYVHGRLPKPRD